jgi:hypothetical protein
MNNGRDKLARLADHLRDQVGRYKDANLPVGWQWMLDCAEAIDDYLRNEADSLDAAFGLKRVRGRPRKDEHREHIARKAIALRRKGRSWKQVADALVKDSILLDESVIREYAEEFALDILTDEKAEQLAKGLIEDMKRGEI